MPLTITTKVPAKHYRRLGDGETLVVTFVGPNGFRADYRSKTIYGPTISAVVEEVQALRDRQRASAARARELRAAADGALPAMLYPGFEPVSVRGVAEQTSYALITRADGSKAKVPGDGLLYALIPEEIDALKRAETACQQAHEAFGTAPIVRLFAADALLDEHVTVTYDKEQDQFVADVDSQHLTGETLPALTDAIRQALYRKHWPFAIALDDAAGTMQILPAAAYDAAESREYGYFGMLATPEDVTEYLERRDAFEAANRELTSLRDKHRFDLSAFPPGPEQDPSI